MNQTDQSLHRFLHAVADPTRRKILAALRERGGCSLDKDTGFVRSISNSACTSLSPLSRIIWRSLRKRVWWKQKRKACGAGIEETIGQSEK